MVRKLDHTQCMEKRPLRHYFLTRWNVSRLCTLTAGSISPVNLFVGLSDCTSLRYRTVTWCNCTRFIRTLLWPQSIFIEGVLGWAIVVNIVVYDWARLNLTSIVPVHCFSPFQAKPNLSCTLLGFYPPFVVSFDLVRPYKIPWHYFINYTRNTIRIMRSMACHSDQSTSLHSV